MPLTQLENQITDAVEKLSENVVSIDSTRFARDFRFGLVPVEGQGSGVVIDARGYVVTNYHVVDDAARVQVTLKDGRTFVGQVIGGDSETDVALIKIDAEDLSPANLGDSEKLKVGQIVLAIGNALGLPGGPTVSTGVISALARPLPGADLIFEGLVQTDAAINPGNSGGPLADLEGKIVGINTAMIPFAQGVGFAIPINTVKRVVEQVLEHGRVVRPWLGISGVNLSPPLSRRYNIQADSGVFIVEIVPGSPAEEAGLRSGDIMVQIGNHEIKHMKDLLLALSKFRIGEVAELAVIRSGSHYRTSLRLLESPRPMSVRRRD